jgi:hypothetical protein
LCLADSQNPQAAIDRRATARAVRFATEPPLTRSPAASGGKARICLNQSMTRISTWLGPADSNHVPAKTFVPAASMSPKMLMKLGALGTKAKNRG